MAANGRVPERDHLDRSVAPLPVSGVPRRCPFGRVPCAVCAAMEMSIMGASCRAFVPNLRPVPTSHRIVDAPLSASPTRRRAGQLRRGTCLHGTHLLEIEVRHHRRPSHPPRPGHHPDPCRRPPTGTGPQDAHPPRPRPRRPPSLHADPVPRPRDQRSRMDNDVVTVQGQFGVGGPRQ